MNKSEVLEFLNANRTCHLATVEGNAPRVRAMGIYNVNDEGIIIQTWKSKDLGRQLSQNPEVELCFNNYDSGIQVRVRGKVEPVEDVAAIEEVPIKRPSIKKDIESGQEVVLYCLKKGLAHVWTRPTNFEPKTYIQL